MNDIKDLHIALDLARFLGDDKRLKSQLNKEERKLCNNIADKIAQYIQRDKDKQNDSDNLFDCPCRTKGYIHKQIQAYLR